MNLTYDIKPISYIEANAASILAQVNDSHRPVLLPKMEKLKLSLWML